MYEKRVLANGLRLVVEKITYVKSVSIGIWVGTGSRNETVSNNGVSHFIEHMLFKGTPKRTAKQIAESIDSLGGQINAFTGKECTCFYARCLDSHIDIAVDVLADMLFNSTFSEKDIKLERKVIIEEIGMYEDSPEELVHDILSSSAWENNPLGYSILGTNKSVTDLSRKDMIDYLSRNYTPNNTVISVAGNFDIDHVVKLVETYFGNWTQNQEKIGIEQAVFTPKIYVREKEIEQVHVCIGLNAIEHGNEKLYTEIAINNVLGGGMSSRLFQKIRENKGLVYSIYSYPTSYKDSGMFTIYAAMNPANLKEVLKLIKNEINKLCTKGLSEEEISKAKEQLKGSYIIGLESTSARMNSIGKSELMLEKIYSPEEVLKKIDHINLNGIEETIDMVFRNKKASLALVGKLAEDIDFESIINGR
ncbi:MAG: M16 family metallopeptidase [Deltaproteobacteria bacterium]